MVRGGTVGAQVKLGVLIVSGTERTGAVKTAGVEVVTRKRVGVVRATGVVTGALEAEVVTELTPGALEVWAVAVVDGPEVTYAPQVVPASFVSPTTPLASVSQTKLASGAQVVSGAEVVAGTEVVTGPEEVVVSEGPDCAPRASGVGRDRETPQKKTQR